MRSGRPCIALFSVILSFGLALASGQAPAHAAGGGSHSHESGHGDHATALGTRVDLSVTPSPPGPGEEATLVFRITDDETGNPASDLKVVHDRILHVLIVREDLERFLHVHPEDTAPVAPEDTASGVFRVKARFPDPGTYRVVADFTREGGNVVTRFDVTVPGEAKTEGGPVSPRTRTFDAYRVTLSSKPEKLHAEDPMILWYDVRDGKGNQVLLEDYLGAKMHIVAFRYEGFRYVHAHPEGSSARGQRAKVVFPEEGRYKIFGQFRAAGRVITTEFVVDVGEHPPHKLPGI